MLKLWNTIIKWDLSQGSKDFFFNICKWSNIIYHINQLKIKKHMMISTDAENVFDKFQHLFMIRNSSEIGPRVNLPQHNKRNIWQTWASLVAQQWRTCLQCRRCRRCGFSIWFCKIPWGRHENLFQYSCQDNLMDKRPWFSMAHGK